MKWTSKHIKQYSEAQEYVDTIILPLVPFTFLGEESGKKALQNEVMSIFVNEIEQKLTGRLIQFPHYLYLPSKELEHEVERVNEWIDQNKNEFLEHIILLTFDSTWKKVEQDLKGSLLWVPAMYSGDIHSKEVSQMINDQINELIQLIQSYW